MKSRSICEISPRLLLVREVIFFTPCREKKALIAMLALLTSAAAALVSTSALRDVSKTLSLAFSGCNYAERLMVGRKAQLGDAMVYTSTSNIDTALTYGEFDHQLFAAFVDRALDGRPDGSTFVDVGSGCGRLVLAAAVLWPQLGRCAGVECVPELHELAQHAAAKAVLPSSSPRCEFVLGKAEEALAVDGPLASADVIFAYSTAFAADWEYLTDFSVLCGTHLRVGTRVVTTDRMLCDVEGQWRFELLERLEGVNRETGGSSVGYVFEVAQSLRG